MRTSPANLVIVPCLVAVSGCLPEQKAAFNAPAPNKRLDAIVGAAQSTDAESLEGLIGQLESTDPAARLLAIQALERRTGETLGYAHADPVWKRRAAVNRWKAYAAGQDQAAAGPRSDSP